MADEDDVAIDLDAQREANMAWREKPGIAPWLGTWNEQLAAHGEAFDCECPAHKKAVHIVAKFPPWPKVNGVYASEILPATVGATDYQKWGFENLPVQYGPDGNQNVLLDGVLFQQAVSDWQQFRSKVHEGLTGHKPDLSPPFANFGESKG